MVHRMTEVETNRHPTRGAGEIEQQLEYPGQIRVTVIRESRAVEFAK